MKEAIQRVWVGRLFGQSQEDKKQRATRGRGERDGGAGASIVRGGVYGEGCR